MRFNDTAGSMARDAVFNAASVMRAVSGLDPTDFDLHVNVVGGGNIDGPSAGLAFFLALYSRAHAHAAAARRRGDGRSVARRAACARVGGVVEKLYAARQAGMRAIVLPRENAREIEATPEGIDGDPGRDGRRSARRARRARPRAARAPRSRPSEGLPMNAASFVSPHRPHPAE